MNNCLQKYMVDKNKIEKKAVINYWVRLFPEKESANEVEKIVDCISSKSLNDYWLDYDRENQVLVEIESFFRELKSDALYEEISEELYRKFNKKDKWVKFYIPLLYREIIRLKKVLTKSVIVEDSGKVLDSVIEAIVDKLGGECYRVLVGEIRVAGEANRLVGKSAKDRGDYFCNVLLGQIEYQKELYFSYPELYRIMNQTIRNNIEYVIEIVKNTEKEYEKIRVKLGKAQKLGKLERIRLGTGDSHNNGKTVAGLVFSDGHKIMYKPRNFQMEESFSKFIDWLNNRVDGISPLGYCKIHSIAGAGWVEFIENEPCDTLEEAKEFYTKMGELLCVLYTFNARDFHCENVIARKNIPYLIDLETLIHVDEMEVDTNINFVEDKILEIISESVHSTALLPVLLQNFNTNDVMEVGAIGSGRKRKSPFKVHVLKNSDGDDVTLEQVQKDIPENQNMPLYNGKQVNGCDYFIEVKEAFEKMYLWVKENKEEYMYHVRQMFNSVECRIIYKPTNNYTQLLTTSYNPGLLHNQMDREIYFHRIGLLLDKTKSEQQSEIYQDEIKAMMQGDVPVYYMRSNDTKVYNGNGKNVYDGFVTSPLDMIYNKVAGMCDLDLKRQVAFIYYSYMGCKMPTDIKDGTFVSFQKDIIDYGDESNINYLIESENLAEQIMNRAVSATVNGEEQVSWIGYQGIGDNGFAITSAGWDIYRGNCGQALFFMRLAAETGNNFYLDYAKKVLRSVETTFQSITQEQYAMIGSGAFTGAAGYIYVCSKLLEMKACSAREMEKKLQIINLLLKYMEADIGQEDEVDLLRGLAGTLGILVSFYPYARGDNFIRTEHLIYQIVEVLLSKVINVETNLATWKENGDIGYAHGNAGIMAQLARANRILQDNRIPEIISKVLRYEREVCFDIENQKWKLRDNAHYFSWCNGIGGILLSKIILRENALWDNAFESEITLIIEQLKAYGFGNDACLCHGDMGTLSMLKKAAVVMNDDLTLQQCLKTTDEFVRRELHERKDNLFLLENWGVMSGLAGIGLGLLELRAKDCYLTSLLSLD